MTGTKTAIVDLDDLQAQRCIAANAKNSSIQLNKNAIYNTTLRFYLGYRTICAEPSRRGSVLRSSPVPSRHEPANAGVTVTADVVTPMRVSRWVSSRATSATRLRHRHEYALTRGADSLGGAAAHAHLEIARHGSAGCDRCNQPFV